MHGSTSRPYCRPRARRDLLFWIPLAHTHVVCSLGLKFWWAVHVSMHVLPPCLIGTWMCVFMEQIVKQKPKVLHGHHMKATGWWPRPLYLRKYHARTSKVEWTSIAMLSERAINEKCFSLMPRLFSWRHGQYIYMPVLVYSGGTVLGAITTSQHACMWME